MAWRPRTQKQRQQNDICKDDPLVDRSDICYSVAKQAADTLAVMTLPEFGWQHIVPAHDEPAIQEKLNGRNNLKYDRF